jgi:nitrate reductase gamma subunit
LAYRRATTPLLRAISAPDDYASNLLVVAWLVSGAVAVFLPARAAFLGTTIALALYAPLGKIRHCVFFFLARGLFGARLGRRGIVTSAWHGSRP